tara:strand:+ start:5 stop:1006 length:1002 start_codon:yes stop_codon:yes gene_type:complete
VLEEIRAYCLEAKDSSIKSDKDSEVFKKRFLSKSGVVNSLFLRFKKLSPDEKRVVGKEINLLKKICQEKIKVDKAVAGSKLNSALDLTRPTSNFTGSTHPITMISNQINEIFKSLGFYISSGPEIEDDWHNFEALNLPQDHPARDMQDTFFVKTQPDILLRTHTSSVQVRHMSENQPPIRTISPGRVFRNEAISSRSHCIFHQIEGLYIDENVSFIDMKNLLFVFAKKFFGNDVNLRFRPSYFPFTEPSAEMDVFLGTETLADYKLTKGTGWLEILGCGMVDPKVLSNCGIDQKKYSGYAFGMGIERIAMLKYGVKDLRLFFENDLSFLKQFN